PNWPVAPSGRWVGKSAISAALLAGKLDIRARSWWRCCPAATSTPNCSQADRGLNIRSAHALDVDLRSEADVRQANWNVGSVQRSGSLHSITASTRSCALAPSGHSSPVGAPPSNLMNCRRLMPAPQAQETASYRLNPLL